MPCVKLRREATGDGAIDFLLAKVSLILNFYVPTCVVHCTQSILRFMRTYTYWTVDVYLLCTYMAARATSATRFYALQSTIVFSV